jgi:transposase
MANGFRVALLKPERTSRFAAEELQQTKTDGVDALGFARFAAQKQPATTKLVDSATEDLKELARLRRPLVQDLGDQVRQLHRVVDLGFPELTRYVRTLDSDLSTAILKKYPSAEAFIGLRRRALSNLKGNGHRFASLELVNQLIEVAAISVGRHHSQA